MTLLRAPILVAACGNVDAGDDGFGAMVVQSMREEAPRGVEAVDLGMNPSGLLDCLEDREMLIIVDAIEPGAPLSISGLMELDWREDREAISRMMSPRSTHGFTIVNVLDLAESVGWLPSVVRLLLVQARKAEIGSGGSRETSLAAKQAASRIAELAESV